MLLVGERERELIARVGPILIRRHEEMAADWAEAWERFFGGPPPVDLPGLTRMAVEEGVDAALDVVKETAGRLVADGVGLEQVVSAVLLWEELVQKRLARDAVEDIFTGAAAVNRFLHHIVLFTAEGYSGVLLVGRDEVRRELESADRLKHELISMVSHDLKTPLTIIQACAVEMLEAGWIDEAQYRRFLEMILQNAERLSRLITRIVDVSRIESRALDLVLAPLDLGAVMRRIVEGMSPIAPVRLDIPTPLPQVHADRDAVERMLVNLIDNAVRFSPEGEKVRVEASVTGEGSVEVRVVDRGPGIPPERRTGLFTKFHQVDASPSGRRSGSGLGLAIVRGLAEAMGGMAGYRDNTPTGAEFWFRIPIEMADHRLAGERRKAGGGG